MYIILLFRCLEITETNNNNHSTNDDAAEHQTDAPTAKGDDDVAADGHQNCYIIITFLFFQKIHLEPYTFMD